MHLRSNNLYLKFPKKNFGVHPVFPRLSVGDSVQGKKGGGPMGGFRHPTQVSLTSLFGTTLDKLFYHQTLMLHIKTKFDDFSGGSILTPLGKPSKKKEAYLWKSSIRGLTHPPYFWKLWNQWYTFDFGNKKGEKQNLPKKFTKVIEPASPAPFSPNIS